MTPTSPILDILHLSSSQDRNNYLQHLQDIDSTNPFYQFEMLHLYEKANSQLMYFLFSVDGRPSVVMPFYLNDIYVNSRKTAFKDVESPYGYSGPIFKKGIQDSVINDFWTAVDQWYDDNNVVSEFIRFSLNGNHIHYSGSLIKTLNNIKGRILDSDEAQWKAFKQKVRKNYRSAERNLLTFDMYHRNITQVAVDDFYDIYISTMNRYSAEEHFFISKDKFAKYIEQNPESCALAIVSCGQVPISTELILLSENTMYSFLGGTQSEYFDKRPNDFLKIKSIDWGRNHDYLYYILGGGRKNGDGIHTYKKTFFPLDPEVIFMTGRKVIKKDIYEKLVEKSISMNQHDGENRDDLFPRYKQQSSRKLIKQ